MVQVREYLIKNKENNCNDVFRTSVQDVTVFFGKCFGWETKSQDLEMVKIKQLDFWEASFAYLVKKTEFDLVLVTNLSKVKWTVYELEACRNI